jgi:hypothetical protein
MALSLCRNISFEINLQSPHVLARTVWLESLWKRYDVNIVSLRQTRLERLDGWSFCFRMDRSCPSTLIVFPHKSHILLLLRSSIEGDAIGVRAVPSVLSKQNNKFTASASMSLVPSLFKNEDMRYHDQSPTLINIAKPSAATSPACSTLHSRSQNRS